MQSTTIEIALNGEKCNNVYTKLIVVNIDKFYNNCIPPSPTIEQFRTPHAVFQSSVHWTRTVSAERFTSSVSWNIIPQHITQKHHPIGTPSRIHSNWYIIGMKQNLPSGLRTRQQRRSVWLWSWSSTLARRLCWIRQKRLTLSNRIDFMQARRLNWWYHMMC